MSRLNNTVSQELSDQTPLQVQAVRGNAIESVHLVDAVVVDSEGKLVQSFGNHEAVTYPRSAIKMVQALFMVESGAVEKWNLSAKEISLACASHNGDEKHVEVVQSWLHKVSLKESDLVCGAHLPYDLKAAQKLVCGGHKPCRLHNNCSGKHTGLLTGMLKRGMAIQNYDKWDHPLQFGLRNLMTELTGVDLSRTSWGVDGCGIPTYAMPLMSIAQALSHFLIQQKDSSDRLAAFQKIRASVQQEPHYVSGSETFCTDFITVGKEKLLVKTGAEGVYVAVLFEQGLAIALKVRDGATRASQAAMSALIEHYKGLAPNEILQLSRYTRPTIQNWEGQEVGKVIVQHPHLHIK